MIICANCNHDKTTHFFSEHVVYQNLCCVRACKCNKFEPKEELEK